MSKKLQGWITYGYERRARSRPELTFLYVEGYRRRRVKPANRFLWSQLRKPIAPKASEL